MFSLRWHLFIVQHDAQFMKTPILRGLPSREVLAHKTSVLSHPRQLCPHRGEVWRRYRATDGNTFSINSGITKWVKISNVRINLHGDPTRKRLRARCSALRARRSVCLISRSPWSICLLIAEGTFLDSRKDLLDLVWYLFLNLRCWVMINFLQYDSKNLCRQFQLIRKRRAACSH